MIVLLKLLEQNNDCVIYNYGYDEDNLDGKIKVSLTDVDNYEITESTDKRVRGKGKLIALRLIREAVKNNDIKEILSYQS